MTSPFLAGIQTPPSSCPGQPVIFATSLLTPLYAVFHEGGGLEFHILILKNDVIKKHLESLPDCETCFALSLGFILCIYSS